MVMTAALALVLPACGGGSAGDQAESIVTSEATGGETTTGSNLPKIEEPPPTAESLVGTWSRLGVAGLIQFSADREFRTATTELDLRDSPYAFGTYNLVGQTITLERSDCSSVWEAGLADEELHVVVVADSCGDLCRGRC
jgi:hypothetical protein